MRVRQTTIPCADFREIIDVDFPQTLRIFSKHTINLLALWVFGNEFSHGLFRFENAENETYYNEQYRRLVDNGLDVSHQTKLFNEQIMLQQWEINLIDRLSIYIDGLWSNVLDPQEHNIISMTFDVNYDFVFTSKHIIHKRRFDSGISPFLRCG